MRFAFLLAAAASAYAQSAPAPTPGSNTPATPGFTRALGYYDSTLKRVVLLGSAGDLKATSRDRVWSWSGARWEPLTDAGPRSRGNASAAYDARRGVAIISGGFARAENDSAFEVVGDSWEGTKGHWERIRGTDVTARDHHSMVFDEGRAAFLLFGGIPKGRATPWPSDTWEFRPDGWTRIAPEGPAGRARSALVYDKKRGHVVLFGGVGAEPARGEPQPFFNDTWVLERETWRKVAEGGPRARYAHGMVFDERAGVVWLYSGAAAHRDAPLSDMWQWDGTRWSEVQLTGRTPGHRYQPVMVYDRARGKTVLYGGLQDAKDDTWEWDGREWREIQPPT